MQGDYILGYSGAEHDRLIRQAILLSPITERLFRDAGVGAGQRVLDIGSGVGDVAILAARLVGGSGKVVGVERDARSIARARDRVATLGLRNVTFIEVDANAVTPDDLFDAVVGRLVLNHCPDPTAMLRSLTRLLLPGGIVAFQEIALSPALAVSARVPLWLCLLTTIRDVMARSGIDADNGLGLYRLFQQAGLPAPRMRLELPLDDDRTIVQLQVDLLHALRPEVDKQHLSLADLGDLETLVDRIRAEAIAVSSPIAFPAIVGAWCRRNATIGAACPAA